MKTKRDIINHPAVDDFYQDGDGYWIHLKKGWICVEMECRTIHVMKTDNIDSIEFDGVDFSDYPDFCDAFICYAERNGEPLNDKELDQLNED